MTRTRSDAIRTTRGPGRPRGNDDTAQRLIEAALETFADVGYDRATTRSILRRANVTAPVLYHHFGNKAGLYAATARYVNHTFVEALKRSVKPEGDLPNRLRAALASGASTQAKTPLLVRFLATAPLEMRYHEELRIAKSDMNGVLDFYADLCRQHADEGIDVRAATRACEVILHGLARVGATSSKSEFRRYLNAILATLDGPPFTAS